MSGSLTVVRQPAFSSAEVFSLQWFGHRWRSTSDIFHAGVFPLRSFSRRERRRGFSSPGLFLAGGGIIGGLSIQLFQTGFSSSVVFRRRGVLRGFFLAGVFPRRGFSIAGGQEGFLRERSGVGVLAGGELEKRNTESQRGRFSRAAF